jgi:hypothetical protein
LDGKLLIGSYWGCLNYPDLPFSQLVGTVEVSPTEVLLDAGAIGALIAMSVH